MTVTMPGAYLTTPTPEPLKGTLLHAASITEDLRWMDTEGISLSYNCLPTGSLAVWPCPDEEQPTKTFNGPLWQDGFRFQTYAGVICESIGFDMQDAYENATRVFLAKESVAVEQALMAQRFIASAGNWAAPTDITPASGAVKPAVGLALLEQHAGVTYAGTPTLHATRAIGALLFDSAGVKLDGNVLRSPQGSKVASGAGYGIANQSPAGVAAPAGESWLYATGEVQIARGSLITPEPQLNRDNNAVTVLVERPYIAVVDCFAAAVRVKVE
jgi:hypothetical protein